MERRLAKPKLKGPGLTATWPDNKIKLSWPRENILPQQHLVFYFYTQSPQKHKQKSWKPKLKGPGLTATWPDNKIKLSWPRETILPQQHLVFYFHTQSIPKTQTEILETTFYKILYHDMRFATNQKLKVTPAKWAIIPSFR